MKALYTRVSTWWRAVDPEIVLAVLLFLAGTIWGWSLGLLVGGP
jgi:hypothetical protein